MKEGKGGEGREVCTMWKERGGSGEVRVVKCGEVRVAQCVALVRLTASDCLLLSPD